MTGWWRSNAVALGALIVLVPATYAALTWNEWSSVLQGSPSQAITVEPGDTVKYAGATVGPASAEFTELPSVPQGAHVVTVTLHIDPGKHSKPGKPGKPTNPPISCSSPELHEIGGLERQWNANDDLGREWDPDRWTFCDSDATGPYDLLLDYLVPVDVSGPFTVKLSSGVAVPEFVSAVVEP
ncbi:hypothetical protein [Microbacterium sp. NPDC058389]|uniref:hypothetical protein n=1 Tax=Microbacterium sp. NPDC058389 TaxID=3346475 RepID=UPI00365B6247